MPILTGKATCRLYIISETPHIVHKYKCYRINPFEVDELRDYFEPEVLQEKLHQVVTYLYGSGRWFDITNEGNEEGGKIHIHTSDILFDSHQIVITDIRKGIACGNGSGATHYLITNESFSEFRWVVCETKQLHVNTEGILANS